jgi:asparagine synthase (glutamine-hydrolysing)
MAKLMKEKVQTYSIGFHSAGFNEAHHAKQVANYLGTNHHEEILSPDPALVIEKISQVLDQPFADSSIVPTYLLAKFARENLIVALGLLVCDYLTPFHADKPSRAMLAAGSATTICELPLD